MSTSGWHWLDRSGNIVATRDPVNVIVKETTDMTAIVDNILARLALLILGLLVAIIGLLAPELTFNSLHDSFGKR